MTSLDCTCKTCPNADPQIYMGKHGDYFRCNRGQGTNIKDFGCIRHPNFEKLVAKRSLTMLTVSILINGNPIMARSAVRVENNGQCFYQVDTGEKITHDPKDGAVVLAKKLLDTIHEQGA